MSILDDAFSEQETPINDIQIRFGTIFAMCSECQESWRETEEWFKGKKYSQKQISDLFCWPVVCCEVHAKEMRDYVKNNRTTKSS